MASCSASGYRFPDGWRLSCYAFSGILLNHMNGKDPALNVEAELQAPAGLTNEELKVFWADRQGLPVLKKVFRLMKNTPD
jgi:hypothetical protein